MLRNEWFTLLRNRWFNLLRNEWFTLLRNRWFTLPRNTHPNEALIFKHLENVWSELKSIYNGTFKNLVYGELPKEEAILETLKMINERLKTIFWTIKIEPMK